MDVEHSGPPRWYQVPPGRASICSTGPQCSTSIWEHNKQFYLIFGEQGNKPIYFWGIRNYLLPTQDQHQKYFRSQTQRLKQGSMANDGNKPKFIFLFNHWQKSAYAKKYIVETYILHNQSSVLTWLARRQRQLQLDLCSRQFTGRDRCQNRAPLYAYLWNSTKHYPYLI